MLSLEGAEDCVALASGMAAISTTMLAMGGGGHVVMAKEIYNTANKLVNEDLPIHGMRFTRVDIAIWQRLKPPSNRTRSSSIPRSCPIPL